MNINPMLTQRSDETYKEAFKILKETGKCAILRPTGFGKTLIMCKISRRYKKVLYVYPTEIIKKHAINLLRGMRDKDKIDNVVNFCTYLSLGKLHDDVKRLANKIANDGYDLIIFDEIHHMGAKLVKETLDILDYIDTEKINILGGTATPDRMDGYDVIGAYFGNSIVSFYGIDNLIEDGLIPEPYYVYSTYGTKWVVEYLNGLQVKMRSTEEKVNLRKKTSQIAKMLNASNIIRDSVNIVYSDIAPQYMRFMVFFSTKQILQAKTSEVVKWFKDAFPNYKVNKPLIIHSDVQEKQNLNKLEELRTDNNTIDLIFSINMLNEGYHTGNITGCVLLRPTQSQIVYTQQVGRCLQVGMENRPIIIDFVENLSTHALYGVDTSQPTKIKENRFNTDVGRMNTINRDHIEIDNRVEQVDAVLSKLNSAILKSGTEDDILSLRRNFKTTAADISKIKNIPLYQVMRVLHNHRDALSKLGLQLQDNDRYETVAGHVNKVDVFDAYRKQIEAEEGNQS